MQNPGTSHLRNDTNSWETFKSSLAIQPSLCVDYLKQISTLDITGLRRLVLIIGNCQTVGIASLLNRTTDHDTLALPIQVHALAESNKKDITHLLKLLKKSNLTFDLVSQPTFSSKYWLSARELILYKVPENLVVIPSLYYTCYWPWYEGNNLEQGVGLNDICQRNKIYSESQLCSQFTNLTLELGLKKRLQENRLQINARVDKFIELNTNRRSFLSTIYTDFNDANSRTRSMRTKNHPTSRTFYALATEVARILNIHAIRPHDRTNIHALNELMQNHATILDNIYASRRLIMAHLDTPYLATELGLDYGCITPFWADSYLRQLPEYQKQWRDY